jgi:hypothetical protein
MAVGSNGYYDKTFCHTCIQATRLRQKGEKHDVVLQLWEGLSDTITTTTTITTAE